MAYAQPDAAEKPLTKKEILSLPSVAAKVLQNLGLVLDDNKEEEVVPVVEDSVVIETVIFFQNIFSRKRFLIF